VQSDAPSSPLSRHTAAEVIERLSHALSRAPASSRPVIAFDADGTIWRGDAGVDVFEALLAEGGIRAPAARALERLAKEVGIAADGSPVAIARALYESWEKKLTPACPEDKTFAMMAWIYAGFTEDELHAYARRVLDGANIAQRIRPEVREIVAWARANDVEVIVASASPRIPVIVGVSYLAIEPHSVLAMTSKVDGGVLQSELTGAFVYAEGKATALSAARPGAAVLGAFGDSGYDAALLRLSAVPVAIGPGPSLIRAASSVPGLIELSTS
jgi:phosphatidylglycerophosphatase C